jgi:hypothetical protein
MKYLVAIFFIVYPLSMWGQNPVKLGVLNDKMDSIFKASLSNNQFNISNTAIASAYSVNTDTTLRWIYDMRTHQFVIDSSLIVKPSYDFKPSPFYDEYFFTKITAQYGDAKDSAKTYPCITTVQFFRLSSGIEKIIYSDSLTWAHQTIVKSIIKEPMKDGSVNFYYKDGDIFYHYGDKQTLSNVIEKQDSVTFVFKEDNVSLIYHN